MPLCPYAPIPLNCCASPSPSCSGLLTPHSHPTSQGNQANIPFAAVNTEDPLSTDTVFGTGVCYGGETGMFNGEHGSMDGGAFVPTNNDDTAAELCMPNSMLEAMVADYAKLESMEEYDYRHEPGGGALVCLSKEESEFGDAELTKDTVTKAT